MANNILIIDDDEKLVSLLREYLPKFGLNVAFALEPIHGMRMMRMSAPDLIILDVMLPNKSGFDVIKEIRAESSIPVLMLSARGEVIDRVLGFELGASDYLPKPFDPRELLVRIQSLLKRFGGEDMNDKALIGDIEVDFARHSAVKAGVQLELTSAEFTVLGLFYKSRGRILTRDRIIEELHGSNWDPVNRGVDILVSRLRQKIGDDIKTPRYIRTVRGSGYKLIAQVGKHGG